MVVGCIDSRTPAEIIFDAAIGDTFNARIVGNVADDDLLGSMEFACAVAGAKVILVMATPRAVPSKVPSTTPGWGI